MKKVGLVLALLATVSMVTLPAVPSYAAAQATSRTMAAKSNLGRGVAVLTQAQLDALAKSRPGLHAKLVDAQKAGSVPVLSPGEARVVQTLNRQAMSKVNAGAIELAALIPLLIIVVKYYYEHRDDTTATSPAVRSGIITSIICGIAAIFGKPCAPAVYVRPTPEGER